MVQINITKYNIFIGDKTILYKIIKPIALFFIMIAVAVVPVQAGPREQAKRVHERLAGVPPGESILSSMESLISSGSATIAAMEAMEHSNFYNITLKNFITPWTNEDLF